MMNAPFHYALPGKAQFRIGVLREGKLSKQVVVRNKIVPETANHFKATIEPSMGSQLVVVASVGGNRDMLRQVLTDQLNVGTALACGDFIGEGSDQIVVGYRGNAARPKPVGISLWRAVGIGGDVWLEGNVDDKTACESLELVDLDGDEKLDIVAAGRASLRILWNAR
jgi:hypothetical protein